MIKRWFERIRDRRARRSIVRGIEEAVGAR